MRACVLFLLAACGASKTELVPRATSDGPTSGVIILTQGRSGSTFVGELLSKIPGALYLYEPCRSLTLTLDESGEAKFSGVDKKECEAFVARILDCKITNDDATNLFQDWVAITKCNVRSVVDLAPKRVPIAEKVDGFNSICSKSSLKVIKEIRLVTPGPAVLQRQSVAILHLVRDVRAVVNSRVRLEGFCLHKGAPGCANPICEEMAASFTGMAKYRATPRYRLVRFEDICDSPLDTSQKIYAWLGHKMDSSAREWVEASTHAGKGAPEGAGKYGTTRSDSSQVAHGWEKTLSVPEIQKINKMCGPILHALGYEVEGALARATALQASSAAISNAEGGGAKEPWWKKNARKNKAGAASP